MDCKKSIFLWLYLIFYPDFPGWQYVLSIVSAHLVSGYTLNQITISTVHNKALFNAWNAIKVISVNGNGTCIPWILDNYSSITVVFSCPDDSALIRWWRKVKASFIIILLVFINHFRRPAGNWEKWFHELMTFRFIMFDVTITIPWNFLGILCNQRGGLNYAGLLLRHIH